MEMLGFSCVVPIETVYSILHNNDALDLLRDNLITVATQEIQSEGKHRREIQRDIKTKEKAIEVLSSKYAKGPSFNRECVRQCLYSLGDNAAFLRVNRDPCDRMIGYLKQYFDPRGLEEGLLISHQGRQGRC